MADDIGAWDVIEGDVRGFIKARNATDKKTHYRNIAGRRGIEVVRPYSGYEPKIDILPGHDILVKTQNSMKDLQQ